MIFSKANALAFTKLDIAVSQTMDNRRSCESIVRGRVNQRTKQYFCVGDSIYIQFFVAEGNGAGMTLNSNITVSGSTKLVTANGYDLWEFVLSVNSATRSTQLQFFETIAGTPEYHRSEYIQIFDRSDIEMDREGFIKLSWTDTGIKYNYDYSTTRINHAWFKGRLFDYEPASEAEIFESNYETILLNEVIKRTLRLEVMHLSPNSAEVVAAGISHKSFYVNDVKFVKTEKWDVTHQSNRLHLATTVKQSFTDGINSLGTEPVTNPYNDYMLVNPIPLSYTPSASGNTANLNEFVTDPSGDQWAIDINGLAMKFEGTGGFNNYEVLNGDGVNNYVTVTGGTLPTSDQNIKIKVIVNGSVFAYDGASTTSKIKYGQAVQQINFSRIMNTTDVVVVFWKS